MLESIEEHEIELPHNWDLIDFTPTGKKDQSIVCIVRHVEGGKDSMFVVFEYDKHGTIYNEFWFNDTPKGKSQAMMMLFSLGC